MREKMADYLDKVNAIKTRVFRGEVIDDDLFDLVDIYGDVKTYKPLNRGEKREQENLLALIKETSKRWHENDEALQKEYEENMKIILERV